MLAPLAIAALLIGGVSTAVVVNDGHKTSRDEAHPVVDVQKIETVSSPSE